MTISDRPTLWGRNWAQRLGEGAFAGLPSTSSLAKSYPTSLSGYQPAGAPKNPTPKKSNLMRFRGPVVLLATYVRPPRNIVTGAMGKNVEEVAGVAAKTRRIELRAEEVNLGRIQLAANLVHEQTSEFVRKAAMQRAEDILRQELITAMEPEQFDKLMSALGAADDASRLAAAARKPAVFTRR